MKRSENVRIAAGILSVLLLASAVFSALCVAAEAGHRCAGEDCPVCSLLRQCDNVLRLFGGGIARPAGNVFVLILLALLFFSSDKTQRGTPASEKVRLNC